MRYASVSATLKIDAGLPSRALPLRSSVFSPTSVEMPTIMSNSHDPRPPECGPPALPWNYDASGESIAARAAALSPFVLHDEDLRRRRQEEAQGLVIQPIPTPSQYFQLMLDELKRRNLREKNRQK